MFDDFTHYQKMAMLTRLPTADTDYALFGLAGEVGELHSYLAKSIRDNYELDKGTIKKELGDILWFIAAIAEDAGIELSDIAITNIEKLQARQKNGTIMGSGDER